MYSVDHKRKALQDLSGKWGIAILAALIASLLGELATGTSGFRIELDSDDLSILPQALQAYLSWILPLAGSLGTIQFIIGGTVQLGYCRFLLNMHDGKEAGIGDLFSQFHRFGVGFLQAFLRGLYVFLWSLLFLIPGIIASYKYAMTPFILAENPNMTANQAITASKELMDGNKIDLFWLQLRFLGWSLLNILTLGIGSLWLNPYVNAAYASFYRAISYEKWANPVQGTWQG